jgi:hypothetical protein
MSLLTSATGEFAAFHAITGESVSITATSVNGFESGGRESKQLLTGFIGDAALTYVERSDGLGFTGAYRTLYAAGFPVIPNVLVAPDRSSVLVPYVKVDGSELYGKGLNLCLRNNVDYIGRTPERDEAFIAHVRESCLPFQGIKSVARQARGWAARATKHDIYLPHDPFELWVRPDSSANILMVDIADTVIAEQSRCGQIGIVAWNRGRVQEFVTNLRENRDHLRGATTLEPFRLSS